jgi:hypothetical protein
VVKISTPAWAFKAKFTLFGHIHQHDVLLINLRAIDKAKGGPKPFADSWQTNGGASSARDAVQMVYDEAVQVEANLGHLRGAQSQLENLRPIHFQQSFK